MSVIPRKGAVGNVSIVIDALESTKSSEAIAPLIAALDSGKQPLHIETRIVDALIALRATGATASVERFAAPRLGDAPRRRLREGAGDRSARHHERGAPGLETLTRLPG